MDGRELAAERSNVVMLDGAPYHEVKDGCQLHVRQKKETGRIFVRLPFLYPIVLGGSSCSVHHFRPITLQLSCSGISGRRVKLLPPFAQSRWGSGCPATNASA